MDQFDRDFYQWTLDQALGDPFDLWIQDIDGLIRDRNGNILLLEIKRFGCKPKPFQARNMGILSAIIRAGIEATGGKVSISNNGKLETHNVTFHGFKLLQLSGETFSQSDFRLDGEPISAEDLAKILRFEGSRATKATKATRATRATGSGIDYTKPH